MVQAWSTRVIRHAFTQLTRLTSNRLRSRVFYRIGVTHLTRRLTFVHILARRPGDLVRRRGVTG